MFTALKSKVVEFFIAHRKLTMFLSVFLLCAAGVFVLTNAAWAESSAIARAISTVLQTIIGWLGKLVLLLFNVLVSRLAPYNDFIDSTAVTTGWVLTRDIANMFFILIILAVAFGTILKIESLNYQRVLPKLLIMAVIINFSKTICGVIIDFGQVVMLTFVNAFIAAAGGNFLNALGLGQILDLNESSTMAIDDWNVAAAFLMATAMLIVALIVVTVFIITLAYRIVILWVLVVLSPIAFLAGGFPIGKASAAYSTWWDQFVGAVIIGPILAFFLWLALLTAGGGNLASEFQPPEGYVTPTTEEQYAGGLAGGTENYSLVRAGTTEGMTGFVIAITLLFAGLMAAQQAGGIAGQFAGTVAGKTKGFVGGALKGTALGTAALGWRATKYGVGKTAGFADEQVRGRERVYSFLGNMGLRPFQDRALKLRQERSKMGGERAAAARFKTEDEHERSLSAPAITMKAKYDRMASLEHSLTPQYAKHLKDKYDYSPQQIIAEKRKNLAALKAQATALNDPEKIKEVNEQYDKNPHLYETAAEREEKGNKMDFAEIQKTSGEARRDADFMRGFAKRSDAEDVAKKIGGEFYANYQAFASKYGKGPHPGSGTFTAKDGFVAAAPEAGQVFGQRAASVLLDNLTKARDSLLNVFEGRGFNPATRIFTAPVMQQSMDIQRQGGSSEQAFGFDKRRGAFQNDVYATSFGEALKQASSAADKPIPESGVLSVEQIEAGKFISNLDVGAMRAEPSDPEAGNQYREEVMNKLNVQNMVTAVQGAEQTGDAEGLEKVKDMLKEFQEEARRIKTSGKKITANQQSILDKVNLMVNNDVLRRSMGKK